MSRKIILALLAICLFSSNAAYTAQADAIPFADFTKTVQQSFVEARGYQLQRGESFKPGPVSSDRLVSILNRYKNLWSSNGQLPMYLGQDTEQSMKLVARMQEDLARIYSAKGGSTFEFKDDGNTHFGLTANVGGSKGNLRFRSGLIFSKGYIDQITDLNFNVNRAEKSVSFETLEHHLRHVRKGVSTSLLWRDSLRPVPASFISDENGPLPTCLTIMREKLYRDNRNFGIWKIETKLNPISFYSSKFQITRIAQLAGEWVGLAARKLK